MVILHAVSVFGNGSAQYDMGERVAGGFYFMAAVYEMVRMLRGIYGVEHNSKIAAGRIFHAGSDVKTADSQAVLLVFYGTGANGDVGKQVFDIPPVFRIKHFVRTG